MSSSPNPTAALIIDFAPDDDMSCQCKNYAEWCRLKLMDQNDAADLPAPSGSVVAEKPRSDTSLIPIIDGYNATRYSEAVYSSERKMLEALGVEPAYIDKTASSLGDNKILCDRAQECLLERSEDCRAEYTSEFEGLLVEKFHYEFLAMKSYLDKESTNGL